MTRLAHYVLCGMEFIQSQQLLTGEIASYCSGGDDGGSYRPCPIVSALVYDALATFDPASLWFEPRAFDVLTPAQVKPVIASVKTMRWRIRTFLAWQQEADGRWRMFGRDGTSQPHLATTACAAAVLAGSPRRRQTSRRADRHSGGLAEWSRAEDGTWQQRCGQAHALRFVALAGADYRPIAKRMFEYAEDLVSGEAGEQIAFIHAAARAWYEAALPDVATLRSLMRSALTPQSGLLHDALRVSALLDLGGDVELANMPNPDFSPYEHDAYSDTGTGSAALTAAIQISNAVRIAARGGQ